MPQPNDSPPFVYVRTTKAVMRGRGKVCTSGRFWGLQIARALNLLARREQVSQPQEKTLYERMSK
jgi:hypothetical protein